MKVLSVSSANGPVFETVTSVKPTGLGSGATAGPSLSEGKSATATVTEPPASASIAGPDRRPAQKLPHLVINGEGIGIQFETDNTTGITIIRLVDLQTGDVVRQIPPEEVLNYLRQFESAKGRFFSRIL